MSEDQPSWLTTAGWWALTIALLVLLDDLTYGPAFWLLSLAAGPVAIFVAFSLYFIVQLYLVFEGTKEEPSRGAASLLRRLRLARRSDEVAKREVRIHETVTGAAAAVALAPFIGGVLPPLLLSKRGWERRHVLWISTATAAIYAAEFAFLHAYLPTVIV